MKNDLFRIIIVASVVLFNGCIIENTIKGSGGFYTDQPTSLSSEQENWWALKGELLPFVHKGQTQISERESWTTSWN